MAVGNRLESVSDDLTNTNLGDSTADGNRMYVCEDSSSFPFRCNSPPTLTELRVGSNREMLD
eukprot:scaffold2597_cov113-Skeletonema_marinoi.AAC.5